MMRLRIGFAATLLAPLALLPGVVASTAAAADDRKVCLPANHAPIPDGGDVRIEEACARFIQSGQARGKQLVWAYAARADSLNLRGEYARALQEFNEAIRLLPDDAGLRQQRGAVYVLMGEYERAFVDLDDAVRRIPKDPVVRDWRCLGYVLKRDYDRALPECNEAIRLRPSLIGVYVNRCEVYAAKGEFDRALRDCDEGLKRNPKTITGRLWRGFLYERRGDLGKALADYQAALAIDPADKATHVPDAIGTTLDDVRAHVVRLQSPVAAGGAGGMEPPTQGDARAILEKRGLLGVWAADCNAPASPQNAYMVYRAIDQRRVQRDVMIGPSQRSEAGIIEAVTDTGADLAYLQTGATRDEVIIRMAGNRTRIVELARNGTRAIGDGSYLPAYGDAALAGKETPWASKCQ